MLEHILLQIEVFEDRFVIRSQGEAICLYPPDHNNVEALLSLPTHDTFDYASVLIEHAVQGLMP